MTKLIRILSTILSVRPSIFLWKEVKPQNQLLVLSKPKLCALITGLWDIIIIYLMIQICDTARYSQPEQRREKYKVNFLFKSHVVISSNDLWTYIQLLNLLVNNMNSYELYGRSTLNIIRVLKNSQKIQGKMRIAK